MSKKTKIENIYNLTHLQEGMLFHYLADKESSAYVEQMMFDINGFIDIEAFEKSFNILIERHDVLRTIFNYKNAGQTVQIVLKNNSSKIDVMDISNLSIDEKNKYVEEYMRTDLKKGFDLSKDRLMRITIIRIGAGSFKILWTHHHIIMDGWSMGIIISEFFEIYSKLINKQRNKLEYVNPYSNYILWLRKQNQEEAKAYWNDYLNRYEGYATIPKSNSVHNGKKYVQDEVDFTLDERTTKLISEFSVSNEITVNTFIQSIWGVLLQKYNNTDDVVFGSVVSGRSAKIHGIENMVGLFINTIPVRVKSDKEKSFLQVANDLKYSALDSQNYDHLPLAEIQANADVDNKLVDHIIVFENYPIEENIENVIEKKNLGFTINGVDIFSQTNYDFNIIVLPGDKLKFKYSYNKSIYEKDLILRVGKHFIKIIETVLENPNIAVGDIGIITEEEKSKLSDFNCTEVSYSSEKTIHQLFEEQVLNTPNKDAVIYGDSRLSYSELNKKANSLARKLKNTDIANRGIIGILMDRSVEMIIGIMAVLKAGCAYLPIDINYPTNRINYMLNHSGAKIVLKKGELDKGIKFSGIILDICDSNIYTNKSTNLKEKGKSTDLAYVIYTSGSTGKPKGVMIEHKAVNNFIKGITERIAFSKSKTILSLTTISFDIFVLETLLPLTRGLRVVIASEEDQKDPKAFSSVVARENVQMIQTTPSRMQLFMSDTQATQCMRNLSEIMIGGEPFPDNLLKKLNNVTGAKIYNMYGPTETTVWSTLRELNNSEIINIGKPISNTQIYILDKYGFLQPIGVIGELCIGGDGLARGYLNNQGLTDEKFVPNPFREGEKIYKTGDLARWLDDGRIECLGRIDSQVKIRGYRIELGEIETQLLSYRDINEAIVAAKVDDNGNNFLCVYIVSDNELNIPKVKEHLRKVLPDYMVPSFFTQIKKVPTLPNGKADRKSLLELGGSLVNMNVYVAPRNEYEEKLVGIMQNILERDRISITDNFFELGGHSLNATMYMARINKVFQIEIPLREIYNNPTVGDLAKYVRKATKNNQYEISPAPKMNFYPMASSQKRLFLINQIDQIETSYNITSAVLIEGKLNIDLVEQTFKKLIKRHESLRTSFEMIDGELVQKINDDVKTPFKYIKTTEKEMKKVLHSSISTFKLEIAPLFHVVLAEIEANKYILLFDVHHIIADGISINILIKDFLDFYKDKHLEELTIQYKDFAVWQHEFNKSKKILEQKKYWEKRFCGSLPLLNIPTDYQRPLVQNFGGDVVNTSLEKEDLEGLLEICERMNTTLYMVLLAAYYVLLHKYSGQEDIIIGTPVSKRQNVELENVVGMFVNTIALRNYPEGNKTLEEFIYEVKENVISGFENQDYQYEELITNLAIKRDLSRNPLFDTMFILQNYDNQEIKIDDLRVSPYELENNTSKLDFTMEIFESNNSLTMKLEFSKQLFKRKKMEQFARHYVNILKVISKSQVDKIKISDINVNRKIDIDHLINEFNSTSRVYDQEKLVHQLFEEQVERYGNKVAVVCQDMTITYDELNKRANKLAMTLIRKGVRKNGLVGIMVERSVDIIVGILGVLKAGGAYLPIDPEYPEDRIKYILKDSNCNLLLTQSSFKDKQYFSGEVVLLDNEIIHHNNEENIVPTCTAEDLAYVIYTSGSTGKPKGIMIEHKAVNNFINGITDRINFSSDKTILSLTTISFDIFVLETLLPLTRGLKVVIASEKEQKDPRAFSEVVNRENIQMLQTTPSRMKLFTYGQDASKCLKNLSEIMIGGEPFPEKLYKELSRLTEARIYNMYGPTETTVWSTVEELSDSIGINIGKPISNTQIYILDKCNKIQPIGVIGELCIGGDGLARGYLNNKGLTDKKFIPNPFIEGERIYKTGDLAMWLDDGRVDCLGRLDNQVKIRGYRIELEEIETQLLNYEDIEEAIVVKKVDESENNYLCAYLVGNNELNISKIKKHLENDLPNYMIPSFFIQIEEVPTLPNGKTDRKSLPDPEADMLKINEYVEPSNKYEEKLVSIMQNILGREKIGITDNFFELGGHSLNAAMFIAKVNSEFNVEISLKEIYSRPTIKELGDFLLTTSNQNTEIVDINSIDKIILRELKLKCKTVEEEYNGKKYYTLFVIDGNAYSDEYLVEYLREKATSEILPHRIVRTNENQKYSHMKEGNSYIKVVENIEEEEIDSICKSLEEEMVDLEHNYGNMIKSKGLEREYHLSPVQKMFLTTDAIYAGTTIKFDQYLKTQILQEAILRLINNHGGLRSCVSSFNPDRATIQEYKKPDNIIVPTIDLCDYTMYQKEEILKRIIPKYYFREYIESDSLVYRMLLVKEDLRNHRLILPFHHVAFDGMSGEVIQRQLIKYYNELERKNDYIAISEDYEEYIEQVLKGPQKTDETSISELLELQKYMESASNVKVQFENLEDKSISQYIFEIPINEIVQQEHTLRLWDISLHLLKEFCIKKLKINVLPVALFNYGREYEEATYFNSVGNFLNFIPIVLDAHSDSVVNSSTYIRKSVEFVSKHNINFPSLIFNEILREEYSNIYNMIAPSMDSLLMLNFHGGVTDETIESANEIALGFDEHFKKDMDRPSNISGILFDIMYSQRLFRFTISGPSSLIDEKADLDEFFKKSIKNLINDII